MHPARHPGLRRARSRRGTGHATSSPSRRGSKPRSARSGRAHRRRPRRSSPTAPRPRACPTRDPPPRRRPRPRGAWPRQDQRLGEGAVRVLRIAYAVRSPLRDATRAAGRVAALGMRGDDAGVLEDSEVPAHRVRVEPDPPTSCSRRARRAPPRGRRRARPGGGRRERGEGRSGPSWSLRRRGRGTSRGPRHRRLSGPSCPSGCRP